MEIELDFNQKQDEDYDGVFYSTDPYIQMINLARSKELDPIKFYHLANNFKDITKQIRNNCRRTRKIQRTKWFD